MTRFVLVLTVVGLAACGAGEPKITSFTLNPSTIAKGGSTTVTIAVENFTLIDHGNGAQALRPSHEGVADNDSGHLHIYLDDTMTNPVVMTASTTFTVKTSSTIATGDHKLIAQLRRVDHLLVSPEVKAEAAFKVQ